NRAMIGFPARFRSGPENMELWATRSGTPHFVLADNHHHRIDVDSRHAPVFRTANATDRTAALAAWRDLARTPIPTAPRHDSSPADRQAYARDVSVLMTRVRTTANAVERAEITCDERSGAC